MTETGGIPTFAYDLVSQLRRRGMPLGVDDCEWLRRALTAGFGWSSDSALRELCVALWAKSATEAQLVRAAFARVHSPRWRMQEPIEAAEATEAGLKPTDIGAERPTESDQLPEETPPPTVTSMPSRSFSPPATGQRDDSLVLVAQHPLTERQIAQAWRGLRRPIRQGPATTLDVAATVDRHASTGLPTPPVLVPRRRNTWRLLVLLDRHGSMTPFHDYADHVRRSIQHAGRLDAFTVGYFHNTAGRSPDHHLLSSLPDPFSPAIDPVLRLIAPLADGWVYDDAGLTQPRPLATMLSAAGRTVGVLVISDGGAARGRLDPARLLDTVALGKALRAGAGPLAWLNPVPQQRWRRTTTEQIARHIPMFPLTREGLYGAVDALRGRPTVAGRLL